MATIIMLCLPSSLGDEIDDTWKIWKSIWKNITNATQENIYALLEEEPI